jgi:hypothetical protein
MFFQKTGYFNITTKSDFDKFDSIQGNRGLSSFSGM